MFDLLHDTMMTVRVLVAVRAALSVATFEVSMAMLDMSAQFRTKLKSSRR
jgi:hypothetical protein